MMNAKRFGQHWTLEASMPMIVHLSYSLWYLGPCAPLEQHSVPEVQPRSHGHCQVEQQIQILVDSFNSSDLVCARCYTIQTTRPRQFMISVLLTRDDSFPPS